MPEGNSLLDALAHPTVVNPLAAYQGAAQTANAIWQTRDWQARQAAGEAQQGAIDPATGEYSPEKMRQGLAAAGPSGALAAQSSLAANQALSSDQLNQARDKLGWVAKASGAALTAGDYSDAAMMRVMMQGSADRMMTMPEIVRQLQTMPADPAGRKAWLEQHQNQAMSTAQQLELRYGASGSTTGPGGVLTGYKQSIQTGGVSAPQQAGVPMGPEAGQLSGISTITNPDGSTTTDTLAGHQKAGRVSSIGAPNPGYSVAGASPAMVLALRGQEATPDGRTSVAGARGQMQVTPGFFKQYAQPGESFDSHADVETVAKRGIAALEAKYPGDPGRVATAYFSGVDNVAPPGNPTPYKYDIKDGNGTLTSAYVAGVTGRYKPGAAPPAAKTGGGTTVPAGMVEAAKDTATQSAAMGTALVGRADAVPTNKANYGTMLADLAKLNTMGPGTERETAINGFIQKLTGYGVTMDRNQVAGAESFAKIANMIAAQQLGSLGATDARQSLAMGANPHLDLSKLGNEQIIHMLQGNEDAINAKAQAWQHWTAPKSQGGLGNGAGTYGQFTNDFNHNFDPRVFQQQYMSKKEIENLRASLSGPGEAQKFRHDFKYAQDQGWIK